MILLAYSGEAGHSFRRQAGHPFRCKAATRSERSDDQGSWLVEVAALATYGLRFCHLLSSFS